jgi:HK97 family phage major capsid protein
MTPSDIQRAFEERAEAVHSLRALATEARDREFTAEESEVYDRQNTAIDDLDGRIDTGLRSLQREAKATEALETFRSYHDLTAPAVENAVDFKTDDQTLFRQLVSGEIRSFESMPSEKRSMTTTVAGAGGNIVDSTMFDRIWEKLEEESMVIRAGATVINTSGGEDLLVPKVTTNPVGAIIAEAAAITASQAVLAQVTLGAFKYSALTQVSQELLADSMFNVASFVSNIGGQAVTRALGADITNGSGTSKPKGIMQAATSFGSSATATTITAANLIEVWATMPTPYKNSDTAWIMSPEAVKLIRSLVDSNGQYIWQPGLQAGTPANLLGYPVWIDGNVDAATSGKRAVGFFHMPSYAVRIAGGLQVDRSDDYAFNTGLATFRFQLRGDGDGIDDNGLGCLTQA